LQMQKSKIDTGKAVDTDLVVTESSGIELKVQDDSRRPGNDIDAHDADIRPIYDEEPMAEVQLTANEKRIHFSKSSAVTTADTSDKRQQQPDSTSSTSTLATTVTADGNFDV
ncbi:hypothetical protein Tco_1323509, partial [Tanacetum coccineum]